LDPRFFLKAITYACSSYPKPGAPHRLSLDDDFERCMITGLSSLHVVEELLRSLEKLERGSIALGDIGLGKAMAMCIEEAARELGHRLVVELSIAIPVAVLMGWAEQKEEGIALVSRALALAPADDAKELVEVLHSLGGEYAYDLEKADLSVRKVSVEGMNLDEVLEALSRAASRYRYVKYVDVYGFLKAVTRYIETGRSAVEALAYPFISLLESEGVKGVRELFEKRAVLELLKLDASLRRRGARFDYLMPPALYTAVLAVAKGI